MSKTKSKHASILFLLLVLSLSLLAVNVENVKAQTYTIYVNAYDIPHAAYVVVAFSLDGIAYGDTPGTLDELDYVHYLNIALTNSYSNNFQGWMFQGILYIDNTFWLDFWMDGETVVAMYSGASSPPPGGGGVGNYTFYGLNDEDSGLYVGSVYVTAYYNIPGSAPRRFLVDGQYGFNTTIKPMYFSYELGSVAREYWLGASESTGTHYIFNATNLAGTVITFRDLTGALKQYDLCSLQRYVNGSLVTVCKRKIDVTKNVAFYVKPNALYTVVVSDGASYTFGDVAMIAANIELTLKGIEFPQSVILANQYIRFWGYRSESGITVNYEDTQSMTTSVFFIIKHVNGTGVYNATHTSENTFQDNWPDADANTTYYLEATIKTSYGTMTTSQTFPSTLGTLSPWSLAFLGTFPAGIDSSQVLPAFAILFVFGLFSVLNAYLGPFFATILGAFFAYMGWMNIHTGIVVAGFAFAIFLGITFAKRRLLT